MGLVGSRSAMLIMREAFYGTSRFDDFVQRVEMAPATASDAPAHAHRGGPAAAAGRTASPGGRTRDEYALTEAGADLMPVIFGLFEWGRRYTDVQPLVDFAHAGCGHPIEVQRAVRGGPRGRARRRSSGAGRRPTGPPRTDRRRTGRVRTGRALAPAPPAMRN